MINSSRLINFYKATQGITSTFLVAWFVILGLSPSSTFAQIAPSSSKVKANSPAPPSTSPSILPSESEYTLGPGDRLGMSIYQIDDLKGEFQVLVDGTVGFPLIGTVKVQGKTIPELTNTLRGQYKKYIKRPDITLILLQPRPLSITMAGEVNAPGSYIIPINQGQKFPTVTDLIQQANGLTPVADISQLQVRRDTGNGEKFFRINLWEMLQKGDSRQNITLRDGDTIVVPSKTKTDPTEVRQLVDANFGIRFDDEISVAVVGEVFRPGSYKLSQSARASNLGEVGSLGGGAQSSGRTQGIRQPVRLTQAIQEAGGIKPIADIRNVEVRRQNRNGQEEIIAVNLWDLLDQGNLDKDVILQNGDTITVPQSKTVTSQEFDTMATANFAPKTIRVNVIGEVRRPGPVELPPNSTLNQGIMAGGGFDPRRADDSNVNLIRLNPDGTVTKMAIKPDFGEDINPENNPTLRNNDVILVNTSSLASTTDTLGTVFSPLGAILGGGFLSLYNIFK